MKRLLCICLLASTSAYSQDEFSCSSPSVKALVKKNFTDNFSGMQTVKAMVALRSAFAKTEEEKAKAAADTEEMKRILDKEIAGIELDTIQTIEDDGNKKLCRGVLKEPITGIRYLFTYDVVLSDDGRSFVLTGYQPDPIL